jgi:hypothetical protein
MKINIYQLIWGDDKIRVNGRVRVLHKLVIVTVENVFAFILYRLTYGWANPKEIRYYEKRIEVLLNEPRIQVTTFNFLYIVVFV